MKFLAILQDSFREAVDSKVFSVMLVLAVLLVLAIGSASFEPQPVAEVQQQLEFSLNRDLAELGKQAPRSLKIVGAEPLKGAQDKPESEFEFAIQVRFADQETAEDARSSPGPIHDYIAQRFGMVDDWQMLVGHLHGMRAAGIDPGVPRTERLAKETPCRP